MYLSSLLIDVGDNPDRPRPGRLWLRNLYHVHQRLCMAFPSASRKSTDADFLKPFRPEELDTNQVHVKRQADAGFLFRIDPLPGGRAVILVQSAARPDWDYAFRNAGYLLVACEVRLFNLDFQMGQNLRFRLVANPTKRLSRNSLEADGQPINEKWVGKRVPVRNDQLFEWLARQTEPKDRDGQKIIPGFSVKEDYTNIQPGYIYVNKKKNQDDRGQRLRSVRYHGILQVTDPDGLRQTIIQGIGPGKAFGFGLLSLAPCQNPLTGEAT